MIVVYDAHCLLCSGSIQFLLRHDRQGLLRFASMQGQTGRQLLAQAGVNPDDVDTVLFVRDGRAWRESAAILRILHALGWPWRLAWIGWLIPATLRDALYRRVARNRYRWFGRSDTCILPPPGAAQRFLD
ncbi:MAG: thiol-disulfide oxidoreductase DCC family protein [Ralstonia sp.]|uniref:Thiol-disulfide oxidoreductase DCC family protein n=1 Tax=Ralstonia pickettii TaxID=329 RepID=A0A9Q2C3L7_RALPI|nr:thiol-disulfide oxidoreductase DCC family protein [Ralstonia pickettii]MDF6470734.1 thiol-disulfide oxidoreductase DCC family protein [Escherichia coli]MBA9843546.1 thiol-disulfide oxidoreductase DCC family protein [Ralstonia pickettii]MBA9848977.1 thiol-disulfide oxidoreductase DCC family protein [Ralstonia pickettii]MBA9875619.1 thiol-disulfide oxidoreductase DCC family protein [Ralstonia pickettii]MBA9880183.1 thiol-disulfide oxidoreductase DCC family protein [Ralstonia pickettii]